MHSDKRLLVRALTLNALFSAFSALFMIINGPWLAAQFSLGGPLTIYAIAAFLLLFALRLGTIARSGEIRSFEIKGIIAGDLAWVAGSILLVALYHSSVTAAGLVLLDVVAFVVLFFAILQIRGLRRILLPSAEN